MSNSKYDVDFNVLKLGFWSTIILAILKLTNVIDVSIFIIFLPLIISIAWLFFLIFLIGLITIYFVDKELNKDNGDSDSDEITKETS